MKSPIDELLGSAYTRLTTGNSKINYSVFRGDVRDRKMPYVKLSALVDRDNSTKDSKVHEPTISVHCFDNSETEETLSNMMDEVGESITFTKGGNTTVLTMSSFTTSRQDHEGWVIVEKKDSVGHDWHSVLDIVFYLQEK